MRRVIVMERLNEPMRPLRASAQEVIDTAWLMPELQHLLDAGLCVDNEGVYFTSTLANSAHLRTPSLGQTRHELLVNTLHLAELIDSPFADWDTYCVGQGVLLARRVLSCVARLTQLPVLVSLSVEGGSTEERPPVTFSFFVSRAADPLLSEDLDAFEQPMLVLRQAAASARVNHGHRADGISHSRPEGRANLRAMNRRPGHRR